MNLISILLNKWYHFFIVLKGGAKNEIARMFGRAENNTEPVTANNSVISILNSTLMTPISNTTMQQPIILNTTETSILNATVLLGIITTRTSTEEMVIQNTASSIRNSTLLPVTESTAIIPEIKKNIIQQRFSPIVETVVNTTSAEILSDVTSTVSTSAISSTEPMPTSSISLILSTTQLLA